jgi:hypothetical protein
MLGPRRGDDGRTQQENVMSESFEFSDWSTYIMRAQNEIRDLEYKLLHNKLDGVHLNISEAKKALDKTSAWIAMQGSNRGVDVAQVLERRLEVMAEDDEAKPYIQSALQEIRQLRNERQFWLQSGYDIGAKG